MATFELSYDTVIVDNKGKRYYFRFIDNVLKCESKNAFSQQIEKNHLTEIPKYITKKVVKLLNK